MESITKEDSIVIKDTILTKQMKRKVYDDAVADFLISDSPSLRQCAKKFSLPSSTLYDLITSNHGYIGRGRKYKIFTVEEEQEIAKTVLGKTNNGKELSWSLLNQLLLDELERKKSSNPNLNIYRVSATSGTLLNMPLVRRFAARNGLSKYLLKNAYLKKKPFLVCLL